MASSIGRIARLLPLGAALLASSSAHAASPEPCKMLPAEAWGSIMGYAATATPGDMNCTYEGANKAGGGQFRIVANTASATEAKAAVKRMRDHQPKGGHNAGLSVIDSQGPIVFSIAVFQRAPTDSTASQLTRLVAAAKQHLPQ